jgi:hypothetical protein
VPEDPIPAAADLRPFAHCDIVPAQDEAGHWLRGHTRVVVVLECARCGAVRETEDAESEGMWGLVRESFAAGFRVIDGKPRCGKCVKGA